MDLECVEGEHAVVAIGNSLGGKLGQMALEVLQKYVFIIRATIGVPHRHRHITWYAQSFDAPVRLQFEKIPQLDQHKGCLVQVAVASGA